MKRILLVIVMALGLSGPCIAYEVPAEAWMDMYDGNFTDANTEILKYSQSRGFESNFISYLLQAYTCYRSGELSSTFNYLAMADHVMQVAYRSSLPPFHDPEECQEGLRHSNMPKEKAGPKVGVPEDKWPLNKKGYP